VVFIDQAVVATGALHVCAGPPTFNGWYAKLDYAVMSDGRSAAEVKAVIVDVHTQPADESGADVGRIMHVGTGLPRLMVVTVDTFRGRAAS
jgi:Protein of unknown function (DUF3160)